MVPGTEQQPLGVALKREETGNRAIGIARTVAPARNRKDRNFGANAAEVPVRAAGLGGEFRIVGSGAVPIEPLPAQVGELEILAVHCDCLLEQRAVSVFVDRLRTGIALMAE